VVATFTLVVSVAVAGAAPQPFEAGSSFGTAPVLAPGIYTDTIQQLEALYAAVDLAEGQRLVAAVTVLGQPGGPRDQSTRVDLELRDPDRRYLTFGGFVFFDGVDDRTVTLESETAGSASPPGRHFLRVSLTDAGREQLARRDFAYRLALEVVQERPPPTTTPTTTPTTRPTTRPTTPPTAASPAERAGGRDAPVAAGLASLALGAAGGATAVWTRRRRRGVAPEPR